MKGGEQMETTVTVTLENTEKLKAAVEKAEKKLSEFKEAVGELEAIQLEIQLN